MEMMYLISAVTYGLVLGVLVNVLLGAFLVMYILGAVRQQRGAQEPQLGATVMVSLLLSVSFHLFVAALGLLLAKLIDSSLSKDSYEVAAGLACGAVIGGLLPGSFYFRRLRAGGSKRIVRQAIGLTTILTGFVFTALITIVMVAVFQDNEVKAMLGFTAAYLLAFALSAMALMRGSNEVDATAEV